MLLTAFHGYDVRFEAKPFADGVALELPRNWVVNPGMNEDFSGDGLPEAFVADDSGTPATGTVTVVKPSEDTDGYGYTRIAVTAGAAGRYKGIKQTLSVPNNVDTYENIWYRITGLANSATVEIYVDNGEGFYIVQASANVATWTQAPYADQLGAGFARVLHIRVLTGAANSAATLDVMMPHVSEQYYGQPPTGKDGTNYVSYGSEVTASPATLPIRNLPGDVDAQVFMQLIAGESSSASGTEDQLVIGAAQSGVHVISFNGEANSYALGGVCSADIAHSSEYLLALDPSLRGRYLVFGRLLTDSSSPTDDTFKLNVYPNANGRGTPDSTDEITPLAVASKWQGPFCFGTIELPMGGRAEWDWTDAEPQNSLGIEAGGGTGTGWKIDHLTLIPMRQGHGRIAGEILASAAVKAAIFDTIGDPPGAYFEYELATSTTIAITETGGSHNWYWGSYADYTANIRSVYLPEAFGYITITASCGGCTFESYDNTSLVARFATAANTTWDAVITLITRDWWNYDNLASASNPTEPPDFDPIFIPPGDSVLVPMVAEYVNDANQNFKNVGAKVALRIVPRYL